MKYRGEYTTQYSHTDWWMHFNRKQSIQNYSIIGGRSPYAYIIIKLTSKYNQDRVLN